MQAIELPLIAEIRSRWSLVLVSGTTKRVVEVRSLPRCNELLLSIRRPVGFFVSDNLNTHMSETLVISVAKMIGVNHETLGVKGKYGILKSMTSRKEFLEDVSHRIRFVFTPKHCSWLNQIEVWFSGLSCRVLRRGSFQSVDVLNRKILSDIEFYNQTAKPMKWKYSGLPAKIA